MPISTRRTRLATAASSVNGSWRGRARSESPAQTKSKPRRSARSANSSSGAACGCPAMMRSRVGSKYPMRMDMGFSAPIVNAACLKGSGRETLTTSRGADLQNSSEARMHQAD